MSAPSRVTRSGAPAGAAAGAGQSVRRTMPRSATARSDKFVVLVVLWMGFEWCRPPMPMKIPMLISLALLASWLLVPRKDWRPQLVLMLAFFGVSAIGVPLAGNYFSAMMVTRVVGVIIVCIAVPMCQFIDTVPKVHTVISWMLGIFAYMAVWALGHGGNGPGGQWAGMDENYTALFMSMAIAMAYFMLFATKKTWLRIVLVFSAVTMSMAVVIGLSRGGFLGLLAVGVYCWYRSPQKLVGIAAAVLAVVGFLVFAPQSFWDEMSTISDTNEGTADMRLEMWRIAVWQYLDHPLTGVGAGNFPWETFDYETEEQVQKFNRTLGGNVTHSLYFELLAEQGTLGVLIFFGIAWYNGRDLRWIARQTSKASRRALARRRHAPPVLRQLTLAQQHQRMLAAAFLGFFVCSGFVSTLYYSAFWIFTALVVGLRRGVERALAVRPLPEPGSADPSARRAPPAGEVVPDRSASLATLWGR